MSPVFLDRILSRQWPFWVGGCFVGLSEIVYYIHYNDFIGVTTGLAQMYAVSEKYLFHSDFISRVYEPGIHWLILSAILGARLVALGEKESRGWVHYHWRMLLLSFLGGFLFSFGTRLARGCTTHHFIGGLSSMSIASWVVLFSGIPFAFLAFKIAIWSGMGGYFRHQETKAVASRYHRDPEQPQPGYDTNYRPWQDPLRWLLNLFLATFVLMPLYFAIFTDQIAFGVSDIGGWNEILWLVIPGLLLGIGIAKCGFGTECAVMAPEAALTKPAFYRAGGVALATYRMFRGMLPLQGFMVAIVSFNLFILVAWLTGHGRIPNASGGPEGLYWGHILGGPLLAMGAVFMIGCEVRTYARLGLGYATALVALPGFYLGYLPYTFFKNTIDAVFLSHGLTHYTTVPRLAAGTFGGTEVGWSIVYSGLLIGLLIFSFEGGHRFLQISRKKLLCSNTDELVYAAEHTHSS